MAKRNSKQEETVTLVAVHQIRCGSTAVMPGEFLTLPRDEADRLIRNGAAVLPESQRRQARPGHRFVRLLQGYTGPETDRPRNPGDIIEVPADRAFILINQGIADPI